MRSRTRDFRPTRIGRRPRRSSRSPRAGLGDDALCPSGYACRPPVPKERRPRRSSAPAACWQAGGRLVLTQPISLTAPAARAACAVHGTPCGSTPHEPRNPVGACRRPAAVRLGEQNVFVDSRRPKIKLDEPTWPVWRVSSRPRCRAAAGFCPPPRTRSSRRVAHRPDPPISANPLRRTRIDMTRPPRRRAGRPAWSAGLALAEVGRTPRLKGRPRRRHHTRCWHCP